MQIKTTLNQRLHAFSHMWNIGLIQTEVIFWKTGHSKERSYMKG
jgi:hypothetical protein